MEQLNNVQALLDAGAAVAQPIAVQGGFPYVTIPNGYSIHYLEHLLPAPIRKRADVTTLDADSFIFYAKKHGNPDGSTIYADLNIEGNHLHLVSVINDHGATAEESQWRDHVCRFSPTQTMEWRNWLAKNRALFSLSEFAAWLEDNLPAVPGEREMPNEADIFQMIRGFSANSEKSLRNKTALQDGGVQFEFDADETGGAPLSVVMFERLALEFTLFDGSSNAYRAEVRLKCREREGKVMVWYELIRPDRIFKSAVADTLARIKQATGLPVIMGRP